MRVANWGRLAHHMAGMGVHDLDEELQHGALLVLLRTWRPTAAQSEWGVKPPGSLHLDLSKVLDWLEAAQAHVLKARGRGDACKSAARQPARARAGPAAGPERRRAARTVCGRTARRRRAGAWRASWAR